MYTMGGFKFESRSQKLTKEKLVIKEQLVNYYQFSDKGDKTLIFLHGWRASGLIWNEIGQKLAAREDFSIFALDLPGFGDSSLPNKPFTVSDYGGIVAGFIEKYNFKNVTLIGHSFGGRIGIKLAASEAEKIKKLILVDSAGLKENSFSLKTKKFAAKIAKPFFKPKFMQQAKEKIYEKFNEDYLATSELKETYLNVVSEDLESYLSKISQPTLIIWGDEDKETPLKMAEVMSKLIPNSKLVIFSGAGHFSFHQEPEKFINEILRFLK